MASRITGYTIKEFKATAMPRDPAGGILIEIASLSKLIAELERHFGDDPPFIVQLYKDRRAKLRAELAAMPDVCIAPSWYD